LNEVGASASKPLRYLEQIDVGTRIKESLDSETEIVAFAENISLIRNKDVSWIRQGSSVFMPMVRFPWPDPNHSQQRTTAINGSEYPYIGNCMYIPAASFKLSFDLQDFYTTMATKVQSHPIDTGSFPQDGRIEKSERQATGISSLWSPVVWRNVKQYLGDLLMRDVTVPEFLSGISIGLINEIQRSRGRIESQESAQEDKIIIFSDFIHSLVPERAAEMDPGGSESRINFSGPDTLFIRLRAAARSIADEVRRSEIISNIDELEKSRGTAGYLRVYENFIASVADYMAAFGSFVPPLTRMLSEKSTSQDLTTDIPDDVR
jgi:hypothetical protein